MANKRIDVRVYGGFAALDVNGVVAVGIDKCATDFLGLVQIHKKMLRMILGPNPIQEIAEMASEIAGLPKPQDTSAGENTVRSLLNGVCSGHPVTSLSKCSRKRSVWPP